MSSEVEVVRTCLLMFNIFGTFGNLNIIVATVKNKSLRHKCGIILGVLAVCDVTCLWHEFQSFIRLTFKLESSTLRRCFWANVGYVFTEPFEVYMILAVACDRLFAILFAIEYRKVNKKKYILWTCLPGLVIGLIFVAASISGLSNAEVDVCVLPFAMPDKVSYMWNQYNLWFAVLTLFIHLFTYCSIYCCTFKKLPSDSLVTQKIILNTVIVQAVIFCGSSVLSAGLIAAMGLFDDPPIDPELVGIYAVIPGLLSYSCNFYVYFWRSRDYRNQFVKQMCCGQVLSVSNGTRVITVSQVSQRSRTF